MFVAKRFFLCVFVCARVWQLPGALVCSVNVLHLLLPNLSSSNLRAMVCPL